MSPMAIAKDLLYIYDDDNDEVDASVEMTDSHWEVNGPSYNDPFASLRNVFCACLVDRCGTSNASTATVTVSTFTLTTNATSATNATNVTNVTRSTNATNATAGTICKNSSKVSCSSPPRARSGTWLTEDDVGDSSTVNTAQSTTGAATGVGSPIIVAATDSFESGNASIPFPFIQVSTPNTDYLEPLATLRRTFFGIANFCVPPPPQGKAIADACESNETTPSKPSSKSHQMQQRTTDSAIVQHISNTSVLHSIQDIICLDETGAEVVYYYIDDELFNQYHEYGEEDDNFSDNDNVFDDDELLMALVPVDKGSARLNKTLENIFSAVLVVIWTIHMLWRLEAQPHFALLPKHTDNYDGGVGFL